MLYHPRMDSILDDIPPPPPNGKNFKKPRKSNSLSAQYPKHDSEAKKSMVLSEKQRQFALYVGRGMTQHAAAKAVGYAQGSVGALMMTPKIRAAIAEEREAYALASQMTKKKVIDGLLEAIDMAKIKSDAMAMISGWREVGKMCGFYEPTKTEIQLSVNGKVLVEKLSVMSDEELLTLIEKDKDALEGEFTEVPIDGQ